MSARRVLLLGPLAAAAFAAPALCATDVVFVADTSDDRIYRLEDLDLNGGFNEPGEVTVFYDSAIGALPMTGPNGVVVAPDGTVFVADGDSDTILTLRDLDDDGNALDPGEATVFFDGSPGGNPGGILMVAANGLTLDGQGRVWVASSNQILSGSIVGDDMILVLEDNDSNGDANGAGEARIFHAPALGSGVVGDSIPTAVEVGLDGAVYYSENGVTGALAKAIWRLDDLNANGEIDLPGEAAVFFPIPTGSSNVFLWDVEQGADAAWYVSDRGNEILWRAVDANDDDLIGAGEFTAWFTGTSPSDLWTVRFASDGSVYGGEAASPARIRRFSDDDASGTVGAGEPTDLYDSSIAATSISNPRCIAIQPDASPLGTAYCFGDGSGAPCPCGNEGAAGEGCANGGGAGGRLNAGGSASAGADTLSFTAANLLPNQPALLFVGENAVNGGLGALFGDGLRCAGQSVKRLGVEVPGASGSASWGPGLGTAGGWSAGDLRFFQVWYRDPANSPCGATFNLTHGVELTFEP